MDKPNMVGERFGKLLVIAATTSKHNRSRWVCECDCGTNCIATGKTLREGKKKSCGCIKREQSRELVKTLHLNNTLPEGDASCNSLHATYKWQAKQRGRDFELTREEFKFITSQDCFYCGKSPSQVQQGASCKTPYIYNGVDRQNNNLGYTLGNCVACCKICNLMKRSMSVDDFVQACLNVVIHMNEKNYKK